MRAWQVMEADKAKEMREAQSRAALQEAQLQARVETERLAAQAAAAKAEQEARARAAQERLNAMRSKWAEDAALVQVLLLLVPCCLPNLLPTPSCPLFASSRRGCVLWLRRARK